MSATSSPTRVSRRQRTGLVLAGILSALNIASVAGPTPEGEVGPPAVVLWAGTVLGIVGLAAVVFAWRTGSRAALRVAAGTLIITALTAVPAFFVDVSAVVKALVALSVLMTIAAVVLMFSSERRPATVTD
ncbi:MAG TPA: hypothetical protein VLQ78_04340 [Ornithinibacter sp.]|nr:hypothetical protein [Ornithinibacter sp.]